MVHKRVKKRVASINRSSAGRSATLRTAWRARVPEMEEQKAWAVSQA
jgi:hypothetical protein